MKPRRATFAIPRAMAAVAVGLTAIAACSSSSAAPSASAPASASAQAPLDTVLSLPDGTWAVVAMGILSQPANTFWQALYRPSGSTQWTVRTPPGVADNGGLVLAASATTLAVGFRPSSDLRFSPLALSTDDGKTYSPALLPGGLAEVPDALSLSASGLGVALAGQEVMTSPPTLSTWTPVTSLAAIQASGPGARCGLRDLTAVVATDSGEALGADCGHSDAPGILTITGSKISLIGPTLPEVPSGGEIDVLRLVRYKKGLAALLKIGADHQTLYQVIWQTEPQGPWTISPTLAAAPLTSASFTASGAFVLLTGNSPSGPSLSSVAPGAPGWTALPDPPARTAAISSSAAGTDALALNGQTFTDYHLSGHDWETAQTIDVPLAYGSSN